ncbi:hypothetical protein C8J57DRAFT_1522247 [Mycena rebaudengoi]|nr:hypothetical protein C8J57DRAFT_1522247 [Mycena rebaudengoi]
MCGARRIHVPRSNRRRGPLSRGTQIIALPPHAVAPSVTTLLFSPSTTLVQTAKIHADPNHAFPPPMGTRSASSGSATLPAASVPPTVSVPSSTTFPWHPAPRTPQKSKSVTMRVTPRDSVVSVARLLNADCLPPQRPRWDYASF